ncbi:MAG TPA: Holliday junction resolvase RuvX [Rhizobiaceae bacterium]|nr:Holliday junction resolvase RuvX [Rhizobiaceae bacterium]
MANIVDIEALKGLHGPGKRLFGLDLGSKTIGIAVSDGGLSIATPYHTIRRMKFTTDVAELAKMAARENIYGLVLGLPVNMDGSEGPRAQSTRAFVRNLAGKLDLPLLLWDERLSSVAAEEAMIEAGIKREKRAQHIDAVAASIILQGALDRMARIE